LQQAAGDFRIMGVKPTFLPLSSDVNSLDDCVLQITVRSFTGRKIAFHPPLLVPKINEP
jgi:hypothetical protein